MLIHVIDAESGTPLERVTVLHAPMSAAPHPGVIDSDTILTKNGTSPVEVDADHFLHEFLRVHAPGHVWGRALVLPEDEGAWVLELRRAGELEVELIGDFPQEPLVLRLRQHHGPPSGPRPTVEQARKSFETQLGGIEVEDKVLQRMAEAWLMPEDIPGELYAEVDLQRSKRVTISGVHPGSYELTLECGPDDESACLLTRKPVDIKASTKSRVSLNLEHIEVPARVPMSGTYSLPPDWEDASFPIMIVARTCIPFGPHFVRIPRGELTPIEDRDGLYRWDAGLLVPGVYDLFVDGGLTHRLVCLESPGRDDLHLTVGEPADVAIRLLNENGEAIRVDSLSWYGERSKATFDGEAYRFRVPAGRLHLDLDSDFQPIERPFDLSPGLNEFAVPIRRSCGLFVRLEIDGAAIPWSWEFRFRLAHKETADGAMSWSVEDDRLRVTVSASGEYIGSLDTLEGCRPVEPFQVTILDGRFVEHVIALKRVRRELSP